jgi:starch synthase
MAKLLRAAAYEAILAVRMAAAYWRGPRPDAIYVREVATLAPALISLLFQVPLFIVIDGSPYREALAERGKLGRLEALILRRAARLSAGIFTFSEARRAATIADYGLPPAQVTVVPNAVDLDLYRPLAREDALPGLGLDRGLEYIVYAGSVRANQDLPVLMSAFSLVHEARASTRLIVLAPEVQELESLGAAAGVASWTTVRHATHEEVPSYLAAASVCVAPLTATTRGRPHSVVSLKLLEYLACGRPAVTADLPFLKFVEEEGLGCLYRPGDAGSLAAAILRVLEMPDEDRGRMSARASGYVSQRHSWTEIGNLTEAFIRERIAAGAAGELQGA